MERKRTSTVAPPRHVKRRRVVAPPADTGRCRRLRRRGVQWCKEETTVAPASVREKEKRSASGEEEEEEGIEMKVTALQRLVPGGESLGVESLFEETAGYIRALQVQVEAMKALASFFESCEKEARLEFGG